MSGRTVTFLAFVGIAAGVFAIAALLLSGTPRAVLTPPDAPKPQKIAFRDLFLDANRLGGASPSYS